MIDTFVTLNWKVYVKPASKYAEGTSKLRDVYLDNVKFSSLNKKEKKGRNKQTKMGGRGRYIAKNCCKLIRLGAVEATLHVFVVALPNIPWTKAINE